MEVPSTFEEGFSWTALVGALFVALLMVPGAMYMQLLAGFGVGPAAQWVTVVLFIEVARRAHKRLRRPEIFVLFYMAGAVMVQPMQGLLWNQFFVQSRAGTGSGVAERMVECWWVAPTDPEILARRSFFNPAWYPAIGMMVFGTLMGRLNSSILSYGLFRVASDIEKLPFPMAPIGAQGIMALAEQQSEEGGAGADAKEGWRWRVFSIGGVLGLSFGTLYMALPAISSAVLDRPITIFPIPFVDWTQKTSTFLPAVATGISLNLGHLVTGMVLPFFAMLGSFIGLIITVVANPLLYRAGMLPSWDAGDDTVRTLFKNNIDFYFSFSIGVALAIALAGLWQVYRGLRQRAKLRRKQQLLRLEIEEERPLTPPGRGDIRARWILATYLFTSSAYIVVSGLLINWHSGVMTVLLFFAFVYTPLISYVTARLEGLAGQVVEIPMVREAAFILSGYSGGVKVWFLPVPMANYGQRTVFWRQAELTGTRFWSIWKAELLLVPIVLIAAIVFAQFIWSLAPIPGPEYPYTERMWELNAANRCIILTSTLGRFSQFQEAFNWKYLVAGAGFGTVLFAVMYLLHMPIMLTYGVVRGLNQTMPHAVLPNFIGALIGRYYFQRRMGLKWRQYIPVVAAGFSCGMGLITVFGVGMVFLARAVIKIPF
ncbi:MAG: hypothetical protein AMJ81_08235 [Phycisphaerae bacterium SM23_33]|nr:MAG: hypothetical protein AMJ81_08235 [Phycisphaerae bacterium SM23_33]